MVNAYVIHSSYFTFTIKLISIPLRLRILTSFGVHGKVSVKIEFYWCSTAILPPLPTFIVFFAINYIESYLVFVRYLSYSAVS